MVLQIGEAELSRATDPGERAQLLEELADVWEQELHDLEQADLLRERGRREIEPLTHPMPGTPTPDDDTIGAHSPAAAPEPPAQQAWLLAARGDVPAAVELLTRTLEREPENVQAIDMMITVLEGTERHTDTASWLERRADLATDPGTRAAVLCRLGAVRELQLGDPMGAGMAYERALQAQPDAQGVRGALARIHRATEAWPKLRGLLEQTILEESGDERAAALAELAVLLEGPFDDAAAALQTWQALLADRPGDRRAMEHAGRLRGSLERAAAASDASQPEQGEPRAVRILAVLERKLEHREREGAGESEEALELRMRIAELRGTALGDPGSAVAVLQPVLDDEETLLRVADLLANLYDAEDRLDTLAELGARVASLTDDPDGRADWLRRAANAAHRGGLTELAAECYRRLLEERPHDREAAAKLRELYPLLGATGELVSLLRDEIARAGVAARRVARRREGSPASRRTRARDRSLRRNRPRTRPHPRGRSGRRPDTARRPRPCGRRGRRAAVASRADGAPGGASRRRAGLEPGSARGLRGGPGTRSRLRGEASGTASPGRVPRRAEPAWVGAVREGTPGSGAGDQAQATTHSSANSSGQARASAPSRRRPSRWGAVT
jgi:tetratricopeptide (TPR) repeat protein